MALTRKSKITRREIVLVAAKHFLETGYTKTTAKVISDELQISPGNLTFHYPTKEHLLLELVEQLCSFQWKMLEAEADQGFGSAASICLELVTVASACAENEVARDFFVSAFQSEMCRNYLRKNHVDRAKKIFAKQCVGWTDEQFQEAEILVMGLQYATVVATDATVSTRVRVEGALNQILRIYNVEESARKQAIDQVMAMECKSISKRVLESFTRYVEQTNEQALEDLLHTKK